jgi:hypothetical protein
MPARAACSVTQPTPSWKIYHLKLGQMLLFASFLLTVIALYFLWLAFDLMAHRKSRNIYVTIIISSLFSPFVAIFWWISGACITSTLANLPGPSGIGFEIRSYDCDTLAKQYDIHVLASGSRHHGQTVLFTYVPHRDGDVPRISVVDGKRIVISIGAISSIGIQQQSWNDMPIEYHIGAIDYPSPQP